MKRNTYAWSLFGFIFTAISGILLHFLYEWTNESCFAAIFSSISESTWEHMKLMYFPLLVFALLQSFFFDEYKSFWCVKLIGIMAGLLLIPVLFYTYNGAIGKSPDWFNIAIFFISAATVFLLESTLLEKDHNHCKPWLAILIICAIGTLFAVFTFKVPNLPIFMDPL